MKPVDSAQLVGLAAIWGASFLFMRISGPEFGPFSLAGVRVAAASLCLLPVLLWAKQLHLLWQHGPALMLVGLTSAALPFVFFSYASLALPAGVMSIFNATTPLFTAVIAWAWFKERMTRSQTLGLAIGVAGVIWLVWARSHALALSTANTATNAAAAIPAHATEANAAISPLLATAACVAATVCYGFAANFTRRHLAQVPPLVIATGSQVAALLWLAIPAVLAWPQAAPSHTAWVSALLMAVLCSGLAYVIFFRLISRIGATNTVAVTFLIPLFALLWGGLFLHEALSLDMALGCAVILLGTALTTGVLKLPLRVNATP